MITHLNYLFLLNFNPFPLMTSFSFFNFILGCFFFMKFSHYYILLSLGSVIFSSFIWWVTYTTEMLEQGVVSFPIYSGIKFSFVLFISSEIFFFFSFFWGYFHFFLSPMMEWNFSWPPCSLIMFNFMDIPLLNTLLLLGSGVTVTVSHLFLIKKNYFLYLIFLSFTYILGLIFSFYQFLEYSNSFFSINDSSFGSCFFVLTGFHGLHVLIGSMYLFFVFLRSFMDFSCKNLLSFELASWYWHFVDVVWIFLFFFVYIMS